MKTEQERKRETKRHGPPEETSQLYVLLEYRAPVIQPVSLITLQLFSEHHSHHAAQITSRLTVESVQTLLGWNASPPT